MLLCKMTVIASSYAQGWIQSKADQGHREDALPRCRQSAFSNRIVTGCSFQETTNLQSKSLHYCLMISIIIFITYTKKTESDYFKQGFVIVLLFPIYLIQGRIYENVIYVSIDLRSKIVKIIMIVSYGRFFKVTDFFTIRPYKIGKWCKNIYTLNTCIYFV